jgi:hypothetical protein
VAPERPLAWLARTLSELRLPYAVIGAHAVNAWLEPRVTADIDVTIELSAASNRALADAFARAGFERSRVHGVDAPSGPDFLRFASPDRSVTIELQSAKTDLQREVIRRAVSGAEGLRVATPEDLIVLKLIANRPKDQLDLLGLLVLPGLDWGYVEHWAREWGVLGSLGELRDRAAG